MNERRLFLEQQRKIGPDQQYANNKATAILNIAHLNLEAKLAEKQGQFRQAFELLSQAIQEQDNLGYNEPPDWFYSIREDLGGLLLRMGQFKEAEQVFRDDLNKHPRNGWALFGLRESLIAQNRLSDAYWVNQDFQKAWQYSSINLTREDL
jgi:tetratricopeptide (TPR) repeat protein